MKINDIITEDFNGEYDDEAGMVQGNLYTIAKAAQGLLDTIDDHDNLPEWVQEKIAKVEGMMVTAWNYLQSQEAQGIDPQMMEAWSQKYKNSINCSNPKGFSQKAHCAGKKKHNESTELAEEFDLIESIINRLAEHNGVDAEVIWEDLETLSEDELYVFAVTSEPIMESRGVSEGSLNEFKVDDFNRDDDDDDEDEFPKMFEAPFTAVINGKKQTGTVIIYPGEVTSAEWHLKDAIYIKTGMDNVHDTSDFITHAAEYIQDIIRLNGRGHNYVKHLKRRGVAESEAWQKANNRDKTDGMSRKAVNTYRREHPGSKLQTAVTTKPSKLKKGSKASKRRSSYCSRSRGQMKMHSISCSKTPDKAICKARRRWNC